MKSLFKVEYAEYVEYATYVKFLEYIINSLSQHPTCAICAFCNSFLVYAQGTVLHSQNCDIFLKNRLSPTAVYIDFKNFVISDL